MRRKPNTPLPPPVFSLTLSSDESEGQEEGDEEEDEGEGEEEDEEDNEEDNEEDSEEDSDEGLEEEEEGDEDHEDGDDEDNEVGSSTEDDTSPLSDQDDPPEHSPLINRQGLRVKYVDRNQDEPDSESETGSILESEPVSTSEEALLSEAFHPECETDHAGVVDVNSDSDGNNDSVDDDGTPDQEDEAGDFESTTSTKSLVDLREASLDRLAQAWLDICIRYGKDAADLPPDDEVDLATGHIIVDNGFLRSQSRALFGTLTWLGEDHEESSGIENGGHRGAKRKRPHPDLKSGKQGDDMDEMYHYDQHHDVQEEQSSQNQRPVSDDDVGTSRKRVCYESDASEDLPSIPRPSPDIMSRWPNQSRRQEYPHYESRERYQDTSKLSRELPRRHDLWRQDRIAFVDKPRDRNPYQGYQRENDGDIAEPLNGGVYNSQGSSPPLSFVNLVSDNDADDEEEGREEPYPTDIGEESSGTCSSAEDDEKENACLDTTDDNADADWPWEDEKENYFKEDDDEQNGDPTAAVKVAPFSIPWRQPTTRLYSNKQLVVFDEAGVRHSQETEEEGNGEDEDNDKENVYCLEAVDNDPFNSSVKKLEPKAKALLETLRAKTLSVVPSLANTPMAPSVTSTLSPQQSSSRQRRENLAFNLSPSDADELEDFEDYFL